jgi:hypothetical protein
MPVLEVTDRHNPVDATDQLLPGGDPGYAALDGEDAVAAPGRRAHPVP